MTEEPPRRPIESRWLRRYAHLVTSANTGAVLCDPVDERAVATPVLAD